ncbi:transcriptional regulator [Paenibacillus baekrokdamisoli]|uniref:Transcriptional regulator n=1 Tax=Paenibacillus baekrokdamisoli TaxID=1712516 RepID=A0A3G9JHN6_9BACL|nr:helix-turn-helix domain-containing protein [Paenibacillus baekrokdamisoli]MBB3071486.1 DNA-binding HxlR family transcriptional regulator [Paenibacillus baekrokdamisoli]BBH24483.1 transcriptional regulator [Paenibacillus baekrokdamisoli]
MAKAKILNPDISIEACAYRQVLDIISNKWTALVIYALEDGTKRYAEIRRRIAGITQKMLTQTLRQLERDGLVNRDVHEAASPFVTYTLTPLGQTMTPHLRLFKQWATDHYASVKQARREYDRTKDACFPN